MKHTLALATAASMLALTACDDTAEEAEVPASDTEVAFADEYDPMTREYVLSEDRQASRDQFDSTAFETEYVGYRDEIVAERDTDESMAAERDAEANSATEAGARMDNGNESSGTMPKRDQNTNMRARAEMTWSYLDRNDDNQLSVAEYAIWAVPLDPTNPKPNDAKPPYVTSEQANKAADSFFYYDLDGDTYLDRREFTAARRGENFDPAESA